MRKFFMFFHFSVFSLDFFQNMLKFVNMQIHTKKLRFSQVSIVFKIVTLTHPDFRSISYGSHVSMTMWLILRNISRIVFMYVEPFSLKGPEEPRSHGGRWGYKLQDGPPIKNILQNIAYLLQLRSKTSSAKSNRIKWQKTSHALALQIWHAFGKSTYNHLSWPN